ncbi:hypothetical protein [Pelagicoccus albus]|uniref:Uncharacterized protein n=1 Tax=Pelagicoccus albus TaxID=415222 RepID=A0A7X1B3U9_9BACT|nr:hypothetical protein [Pelagicoccus albus]MBC2605146.1 hypothetical protein [Pelagicoccus albus]
MKTNSFTRLLQKFVFSATLFSLWTATAQACSVCVVSNDESRAAYYATTAFLSFLPLMMIGGVVYYIFKKYR